MHVPRPFDASQKADVLGEAAAIENRIIPQAGIEAEKDHLGGSEKFMHGQGEGFPFLLILAVNAQKSEESFPILPHPVHVGIFPYFGKRKISARSGFPLLVRHKVPGPIVGELLPPRPNIPTAGY